MPSTAERGAAPGPGVDASGRPVIDPTQNVLDLVQAAIQRQDDLRELEARHVRELNQQRADYEGRLREAESKRIDAIRAVDVAAVQQAAAAAETRANTLATTVAQSAEALRVQAQQGEVQFRQLIDTSLKPLTEAVAELREVQYKTAGERAQTAESRDVVRDERTGQQFSITTLVAIVIGAALLLLGVLNYTRQPTTTTPTVQTPVTSGP